MKQKLLILFILILFADLTIYSQGNWKLRKNEDGIKIYTRERENIKAIEFKGTATFDVPVSKLIKVLRDVDNYHLWMADLKTAKKLKTLNENEWYAWYAASVPWPMEDRDVIYLVKVFNNKESTVFSLKSKPELVPKNKNYVRVNEAEGKWVFTPISEHKTHVMYQFYADPGINVPMWITNMFIVSGPYDTLIKLKEICIKK